MELRIYFAPRLISAARNEFGERDRNKTQLIAGAVVLQCVHEAFLQISGE